MLDSALTEARPIPERVECGNLVFTRERVEKIRSGVPVLSFSRQGVLVIRLHRDSGSEHPLQETLWAIGLALGGVLALRSGISGHDFRSIGLGIGLCSLAMWMFVHLFRRIPILTIQSEQGTVRVEIEANVSDEQLELIRRRVREQLQWPAW